MGKVTCIAGGGAQQTWRLEGAGAPHDFAVAAAPMPVRGAGDRALALYVAETKPAFSSLRKYLFVPHGELWPPCQACISAVCRDSFLTVRVGTRK